MTAYSGTVERTSPASGVWLLPFLGAAALSIITKNPLLTLACVSVVPLVFVLLRRPGEPPVLLFVLGMQWIQVSTKVFHADSIGVPVQEIHPFGGDVEMAIFLALLALVVLAVGMRLGIGQRRTDVPVLAWRQAHELAIRKLWISYLATLGFSIIGGGLAWAVPALTQPILALLGFKWVFAFMLAYTVFVNRRGHGYLGAVIVIEVVLGFTGFFSSFRGIFEYLIIAYLAARPRIASTQAPVLLLFVGALFTLSVVWTAVKTEYRGYVSGETRAQVLLVGWEGRFDYMLSLIRDLDGEDLRNAMEDFAERVAYVDYFAAALTHVPANLPHEEGALLGNALLHILMPRVLFPDKPAMPRDTEITAKYTGLSFAGAGAWTSISMGYVADNYVDFGPIWMFVPIFAFGFALGRIYRYFIRPHANGVLVGYGLAVMAVIGAGTYETMFIKLIGSTVTLLLAAVVLQRWVLPGVLPLLVRRQAVQF